MKKYYKVIVELSRLTNTRFAHSPMTHDNNVLVLGTEPVSAYPYATMISRLLWLACTTRPDIVYATCLLARFSFCFNESNINVPKRILHYTAGAAHIGINYDGNGPFQEFTHIESDYAQQYDLKSIGDSIVMLGGGHVACVSSRQESVAKSTM